MQVQSLGREDPVEKEMATHCSILACRIPMDREAWWATVHSVHACTEVLSSIWDFISKGERFFFQTSLI